MKNCAHDSLAFKERNTSRREVRGMRWRIGLRRVRQANQDRQFWNLVRDSFCALVRYAPLIIAGYNYRGLKSGCFLRQRDRVVSCHPEHTCFEAAIIIARND